MGAAAARVGGVVLVQAQISAADATSTLAGMGVTLDQIFVTGVTTPAAFPWAIVVVSATLGLLGLILLGLAWGRRRRLAGSTPSPVPTSTARS